MPVLPLDSIQDTTLWKRLQAGFSGPEGQVSQVIAIHLQEICREAYDRMKAFPSLHPEYTLHDQTHLLRVTELMSRVLPDRVADRLNPVEIMLLILAAHFHDQGMVLSPAEIETLRSDPKFLLFRDNWAISHPNLQEIQQHLRDRNLSEPEQARCREIEQELHAALLTDYVRETHGERSARFVRETYGSDRRWEVAGTNVAELSARLCLSHVRPARDLISVNGFRHDESVGPYQVNMSFLGVLLRLADVLDFDRDRTPDSLYRTIHFKSRVSLREWEKHRSVEGWVIEPTLVRFTMRCEHPEYQRAAYQFMDWIDHELTAAHSICRSFPAAVAHYTLDLPLTVDRSHIEPKDGAYIYSDLEFSLSRDEVVKLLMADKLYGAPWLCVRELLQNALDALRHRRAVIRRDLGSDWTHGKVEMTHELDTDGYEVVRCTDNGIGMDRSIVERFLTRAGRSYYRSPEFEQERASFRAAGVDFDPCAQFGIGFMSCFMLGDRVVLRTRRDHGPRYGHGEPLIVEINGLGGIVVLRPGPEDLPVGTTVEIIGRRKPSLLDRYEDRVKLVAVLDGYALATEFPIIGRCKVPGLPGEVHIPPVVAIRSTAIEKFDITSIVTLEQSFSEFNPLLTGSIRVNFIVNDQGEPVLRNTEAEWREAEDPANHNAAKEPRLWINGECVKEWGYLEEAVCVDGILVAGEGGRDERLKSSRLLGRTGNIVPCADYHNFSIDIRGNIKPPLTPARTPLVDEFRVRSRGGPRWERIQMWINRAQGMLLAKLLTQFGDHIDYEIFWILASIYGKHGVSGVFWMPAGTAWKSLAVPVIHKNGDYRWAKLTELPRLVPIRASSQDDLSESTLSLQLEDGAIIDLYPSVAKWLPHRQDKHGRVELIYTVASMATVTHTKAGPQLELRHPEFPDLPPWEFAIPLEPFGSLLLLPYSGEIKDILSAHLSIRNANRHHPLSRVVLDARWLEEKTDLQNFAEALVQRLSDPSPFDNRSFQYWQKRIGHLYRNLDWESIDRELHPPYRIYTAESQMIEVTGEMLEGWADLEVDLGF